MDEKKVSAAFNAWLDDYTKDPDRFEAISKSAMRHLNEKLAGCTPTYGEACAALLSHYMNQ